MGISFEFRVDNTTTHAQYNKLLSCTGPAADNRNSIIIIIIIIMMNYYIVMSNRHGILSFSDAGIDCFKCVSLEWQNRACDDPFHNNFSSGLLESPCMGGRKGRNGLFPATACIKLTGYYSECFIRHL